MCKAACECTLTHTTWPDCSVWPPWCNEAPEHHQYQLGTMQAIKDDQHHTQCHAMDNNATTTMRLPHPLHTIPGPGGDEHTPFKGCASTSEVCQEVPRASWTAWKPHWLHSHCKVMPPPMHAVATPVHTVAVPPLHPNVVHLHMHAPYAYPLTTQLAHPMTAHPNIAQSYVCKASALLLHTKVVHTTTTIVMPHTHTTTVPPSTAIMLAANLTTALTANPMTCTAPPAHPTTAIATMCKVTTLLSHTWSMMPTTPPTHPATPVHAASPPPSPLLVGAPPVHTTTVLPDHTAGPRTLHALFFFNSGAGFHVTPPGLIHMLCHAHTVPWPPPEPPPVLHNHNWCRSPHWEAHSMSMSSWTPFQFWVYICLTLLWSLDHSTAKYYCFRQ